MPRPVPSVTVTARAGSAARIQINAVRILGSVFICCPCIETDGIEGARAVSVARCWTQCSNKALRSAGRQGEIPHFGLSRLDHGWDRVIPIETCRLTLPKEMQAAGSRAVARAADMRAGKCVCSYQPTAQFQAAIKAVTGFDSDFHIGMRVPPAAVVLFIVPHHAIAGCGAAAGGAGTTGTGLPCGLGIGEIGCACACLEPK
jgi:hypothetical protein